MEDMAFSNLKLASAGEVVKIWDSSSYKICHQVSSKNLSLFQSVHWSSDGNQIISVPVEGDKILMSYFKTNLPNHIEIPMKGCTIAKFCTTSNRFIGIGKKDGSVMTWDLKHKKPRMTFGCRNSEVTCLQFNYKDTSVACGYVDGSLVLHSTTTGQSTSPLIYSDVEKITDLHFSFAKKSLLGCCSQDGSIALWDANTRQILKRLCEHKAPATGFRFSPTNSFLFLSVGLDKNIHFYDTKSRKLVRTIPCDTPLCSADFKDDGVTITVGCSRGRIYFYDLRYTTGLAQHTLHAHNTSVQSLAFQSCISSKEKLRADTTKSEANSIYDPLKCIQNGTQFDFSLDNANAELKKEIMTQRKESLTCDLFSPIRESFRESYIPGNEQSRNLKNSTFLENPSFSFAALSPLQNRDVADNLSKLTIPENIFEGNESDISAINTSLKSPLSINQSIKPASFSQKSDFDGGKSESKSLKQQLFKAALSPQSALGMCSRSGDCAPEALWSCSGLEKTISPKSTQDEGIVLQQPKLLENSVPSDIIPHNLELHDFENNILQENSDLKTSKLLMSEMSDLVDEGKGTSKSTTPMTPQVFQVEFFKQLLVDAMEEQTDAIRRNFQRLHVQMVREFEEQRSELDKMFKKYSHHSVRDREMRKFHEDF